MRRLPALAAALLAAAGVGGCGGSFKLPTESPEGRLIPGDETYQMVATWSGMHGIADILLTQGSGTQLFLLFNDGGTGAAPRGRVRSYLRLRPSGMPDPISGVDFANLFNPIALAAGGDGAGASSNRIFVLDRGDSCLARANPVNGSCTDTTGGWSFRISNLSRYWRVREFGLLGGDSLTSFTDTTLADVSGVAADARGRVYVSGLAIVLIPDPNDARIRTRTFQWRIHRYLRGPRYPGVFPPDRRLPGANWHRDTTWVVDEGSGIGTVVDPRGLTWTPVAGGALLAADFGKNWIQKLSDRIPSAGDFQLDGGQTDVGFVGPVDVTADASGFIYIVDNGNRRVLRYDPQGVYVQRVDIEPNDFGRPLLNPVAAAANDSLVYVADPDAGEVIRYQRRR